MTSDEMPDRDLLTAEDIDELWRSRCIPPRGSLHRQAELVDHVGGEPGNEVHRHGGQAVQPRPGSTPAYDPEWA